LERYPGLIFVGAHLGSMEWSLEEVAKRLERFPNFYVDLSVKFEHIFEQTLKNRKRVVDFFETYRDRILYGSDYFVTPYNRRKWMNLLNKFFPQAYTGLIFRSSSGIIKKHWLFLATDEEADTGGISGNVQTPKRIKGLQLNRETVDRIFYENIRSVYLSMNFTNS
jgi:predicted TIM-barrel fold metal-dependent hydrolase